MQDMILDRLRADHQERFSADAGEIPGGNARRPGAREGDPMPRIAHAMVLALAVSVASLGLSIGAMAA